MMKKRIAVILGLSFPLMLWSASSMAATEQAKKAAIDQGLAWLAGTQATSGSEGYWSYSNYGTLAATGSAALAFIEEGYLPGSDVVIGGSNYGDVVGKACNYIFNRATADSRFSSVSGTEYSGYTRRAEDYNNDGILNDGGNNQAIYFNPGAYNRNVYTTGVVAPVVYALGEALGKDTAVGRGAVTSSMTYKEVMRDVIDWFSWGQVEPNRGVYRGGWRYDANWGDSDQSTAQWGSLPMLYGNSWGLATPDYVSNELELWLDYTQNNNGGIGYNNDYLYLNVSKTGGGLVEMMALEYDEGVNNNPTPMYNTVGNEVDAALNFINSRWNNGPSGTWYGNIGHPYAMWAVYKALELYGKTSINNNGTPGDTSDDFLIGFGMSNAPGGYTIGQDWDPKTSLAGDWYSHYSEYLVNSQNANGSWSGYSYFTGALATGWNINILNAAGAPPPINGNPVPEPATMLLFGTGLAGLAARGRKKLTRRS